MQLTVRHLGMGAGISPFPQGCPARLSACHMGILNGNADFIYNICVARVPITLQDVSYFFKDHIDIFPPVCYHTITPRHQAPHRATVQATGREGKKMKLKYFMAQVRKHGQPGNTYYIGGVHYTVSGFVKQLEEQGFDVICAYITTPKI